MNFFGGMGGGGGRGAVTSSLWILMIDGEVGVSRRPPSKNLARFLSSTIFTFLIPMFHPRLAFPTLPPKALHKT